MALGGDINSQSIVIIDEADVILLDRCDKLINRYVYGLSATAFGSDHNSVSEYNYIQNNLKFSVLDSKLPGFVEPN